MAGPKILESSTHLFLLLVTIFQTTIAISYSSYSSLCHFPVPSPDLHTGIHDHSRARASNNNNLPQISTGHFSGGDDILFAPEQSYALRSFSFIPRHSALTTDPAVVRLVATLALEGLGVGWRRREHHHSVTFELEGYYSTATSSAAELCMVGSGSYARDDGTDADVHLSDVGLHLPRLSNLSQPFVTGHLEGAGFGAITLVAYYAGDESHPDSGSGYTYAQTVSSCPPPVTPVRDGQHVLSAGFSCSYELEHRPAGHATGSSRSPLQLGHRLMYVNQMSCATDGDVRAYLAFYANHSDALPSNQWRLSSVFLVGDEALVAEGFWDSSRSQLCLRACRVVRSGLSRADLAVGECGIGVSFWFPDTWSFQDRKIVVGLISNSRRTSDGDTVMMSDTASVSRSVRYTGDLSLSDIKYKYTLVEKAKELYHSNPVLSKDMNGSFPGNHSCRDFVVHFNLKKPGLRGHGSAWPVTIGSTVLQADRPMPHELLSRYVLAEVMNTQRLLNVSYDLEYTVAYVKWRINAEGVYDTKTGSLCMVACRVGNGWSDCQVLVTVHFAPVDTEHAVGTISSLRTKSDPLFFEALEFESQGIYVMQRDSRIDVEIIMLVLSPALFSVVVILQLRHVKKHPEAVPSMSITMLVVLALGYLIPLMLDFEPTIRALQNRFDPLWMWYNIEPNRIPLRVTNMLAFLLQLRLLQVALSGRRPTEPARGVDGSSAAAERRTLQACLLLYFLGAVLMLIFNRGDVLMSFGGLVLDGFLLPQVISNAFSGAKARALSPWFYVGGTVIRAAPHASDVYAGDNLFGGVALDVAVLLGAALLTVLLFLQQRVRVQAAFLCSSKRRSGAYRMVSSVPSC